MRKVVLIFLKLKKLLKTGYTETPETTDNSQGLSLNTSQEIGEFVQKGPEYS